jgi:Protein of unknown function (DUF2933)
MTDDLEHTQSAWASRAKLAFIAFAGIGAFLLLAEHRAHVLPYLPWLFLAACTLMHIFMHHGHGHGHRHEHGGANPPATGDRGSAESGPEGSWVNNGSSSRANRHRGD